MIKKSVRNYSYQPVCNTKTFVKGTQIISEVAHCKSATETVDAMTSFMKWTVMVMYPSVRLLVHRSVVSAMELAFSRLST